MTGGELLEADDQADDGDGLSEYMRAWILARADGDVWVPGRSGALGFLLATPARALEGLDARVNRHARRARARL